MGRLDDTAITELIELKDRTGGEVRRERDERRSGWPTKLSDEQRSQLFEGLRKPATEFGYDRQAWTSNLAAHHIRSTDGIEYSERHVRQLLNEAGPG